MNIALIFDSLRITSRSQARPLQGSTFLIATDACFGRRQCAGVREQLHRNQLDYPGRKSHEHREARKDMLGANFKLVRNLAFEPDHEPPASSTTNRQPDCAGRSNQMSFLLKKRGLQPGKMRHQTANASRVGPVVTRFPA